MCINDIQVCIDKARDCNWATCMYGTGRLGSFFGCELFELLKLKMDYVTDMSMESLKRFGSGNAEKMSVEELIKYPENILVIVCVGVKDHEDISRLLKTNTNISYFFMQDLIGLNSVVNDFYHVERIAHLKKKIAVFTCITGGYDELIEPKYISDGCDYYFISDQEPKQKTIYKYIEINNVVPQGLDDKEKNRYCKMHGHMIFPQYDYSIYIDGSICILGDISSYTNEIGYCGLAMLRHPHRNCIYEEGIQMVSLRRSDRDRTIELLNEYIREGMPRNYGLFECGVIVSETMNKMGNNILEHWYKEYMRHQLRDQFSLPYVLWKNGYPAGTIGFVDGGRDCRKSNIAQLVVMHGLRIEV